MGGSLHRLPLTLLLCIPSQLQWTNCLKLPKSSMSNAHSSWSRPCGVFRRCLIPPAREYWSSEVVHLASAMILDGLTQFSFSVHASVPLENLEMTQRMGIILLS